MVLVGTAFPLLYSASGVTLRADPTSVSGLVVRARLNRSSTEVGSAPSPSWSVSKQDVCVGVLVGEEDRVIRLWTPPFLCVPSARNGRFLGTKCKSDHFPRLSTLTCAPRCHLLSKPPFLSTPHPSTPLLLLLFLLSHTLFAAAVSVLFYFYFFCPFYDWPHVLVGRQATRRPWRRGLAQKKRSCLDFFSPTDVCLKRRGKRTVCGV